jgi:GDP-L-fucose synthase
MTVLVTGGSGFLGKMLRSHRPDWIYISSNDYDLTNQQETKQMYSDHRPDAVIHLAARVGGIKDNAENQVEFFEQNTLINLNVVSEAYKANVNRLLASLSTCAYPDKISKYPFREEDFFKGPPAPTNFSYGFSKRMLHALILSYRKQYGINYSTFSPSNIYGPQDYFDSDKSHFVSALISKVSKLDDYDVLELWGSGKPLRQQLYIDDLCEIIPKLLTEHNSDIPLIVAPKENLSIDEMTKILLSNINKSVKIVYNKHLDGQYRKDGNNSKLLEIIGDFKFTTFQKGILKTYNWYLENK